MPNIQPGDLVVLSSVHPEFKKAGPRIYQKMVGTIVKVEGIEHFGPYGWVIRMKGYRADWWPISNVTLVYET